MKRTIISSTIAILIATVALAQPQGMPRTGGQQFKAEKPNDPSFETKEVYMTSRGGKIYGVACIPFSGPAKKPTVLLLHGIGSNSSTTFNLMKQLAMDGFLCYAIDFQGGGMNSQSDGDMKDMSIFTEKQNLLDVLATIRTWDNVDLDNVFFCGQSQGGCVAAITAPEVQNQVKAIVLQYPALCIPDDAKALFPTKADIPDDPKRMGTGKAYYEDIIDYDIYSVIAGYKRDVLLLHGDKDPVVKISYSDKASEIYENVEYHVIKGAGHGFRDEAFVESSAYVKAFLKKEVAK